MPTMPAGYVFAPGDLICVPVSNSGLPTAQIQSHQQWTPPKPAPPISVKPTKLPTVTLVRQPKQPPPPKAKPSRPLVDFINNFKIDSCDLPYQEMAFSSPPRNVAKPTKVHQSPRPQQVPLQKAVRPSEPATAPVRIPVSPLPPYPSPGALTISMPSLDDTPPTSCDNSPMLRLTSPVHNLPLSLPSLSPTVRNAPSLSPVKSFNCTPVCKESLPLPSLSPLPNHKSAVVNVNNTAPSSPLSLSNPNVDSGFTSPLAMPSPFLSQNCSFTPPHPPPLYPPMPSLLSTCDPLPPMTSSLNPLRLDPSRTSPRPVTPQKPPSPLVLPPVRLPSLQPLGETKQTTLTISKKEVEVKHEGPHLVYEAVASDGFKLTSTSLAELYRIICESVQEARSVHCMPQVPLPSQSYQVRKRFS